MGSTKYWKQYQSFLTAAIIFYDMCTYVVRTYEEMSKKEIDEVSDEWFRFMAFQPE